MTRRDVRTAVAVVVVVAILFVVGLLAPDPETKAGQPPSVEQADSRDEPNSDYERCIADDGCLRDLLEFTERGK